MSARDEVAQASDRQKSMSAPVGTGPRAGSGEVAQASDRQKSMNASSLNAPARPEFSPRMLRLFIEARIVHRLTSGDVPDSPKGCAPRQRVFSEMARIFAKAAGVPAESVRLAQRGLAFSAVTRVRLFSALGVVPAEHGVMLIDGGGQERIAATNAVFPRKGERPSGPLAGHSVARATKKKGQTNG